jgi:hypothetical protein
MEQDKTRGSYRQIQCNKDSYKFSFFCQTIKDLSVFTIFLLILDFYNFFIFYFFIYYDKNMISVYFILCG